LLTELSIRNFAIIDDISITFHEGLTVLTGETGAGKSIIIDAVELLAGARASVHYVRHGEKKAESSGLFSLKDEDDHVKEVANFYDIDIHDQMLVLERTITKQGKSICKINNKIVTLSVLKEIGQKVVNIHSQHDTIQLMDEETHIQLLDAYDEKQIYPLIKTYDALYTKLIKLKQKHRQLQTNEQDMVHRLDFIQFQLHEIEEANLQIGEDEALTDERNKLHHHEKLYRTVDEAYSLLADDKYALELLDIAQNNLQQVKDLDENIEHHADDLSSLFYQLEEISFSLRQYIDTLYYDENELNDIESRLNEINHLKKKYGLNIEEIFKYKVKIEREIDEIEHKEDHLLQLEKEMSLLEDEALIIAKRLHSARKKAALSLEKEIEVELKDLYLENATFSVHFKKNDTNTLYAKGIDQITFMVSTNIGEPLNELAKVASGGELSRIMLALKNIFSKHDQIQTVIFDEIDTGVSGRVAQSIAEKMYEITKNAQVLCITHLPQVAAMSDNHLLIEKHEVNERTATKITDLSNDEKINEIGKMFTGTELTETAIEHAQQLLHLTNEFKRTVY